MRKVSAVLAIVFVLYALPDLVGEHEVVYRIFRVGKEGPIWMESHKDVNLERGEPSMGSIVPMPPLSSEYDYELETLIDGELWGERTPYSIEDREALRREIPEDTGEISETEAVGLVIQGPSETNNTLLQNSLGIGFGSGDPTAQLDVRSGHVRIWDGGATPGYANLAGDLFIANELEVDGTVYSTNWRDAAGNPMLAGGTDISVSEDANGQWTINNTNPDQTVAITAGTGINVTGSYPSFTVANTVPDQTVALTGGTGISITGTYPNFTVTNSSPSSGGTLTSIATSSPITGGTITTTGTIGLQQQGDIIGGTDITVTGGTDILPGSDAADVTISFTGSTDDGDWTTSGSNIYRSSGNVGIGTTSPASNLDVNGTIRADSYRSNDGTDLINAGANIAVTEEADGSWTVELDGGGTGETYNFTNCGATGRTGPTQIQANSTYSGTTLDGDVTISGSGIQQWTVPATGTYTITAAGAAGGTQTYSGGYSGGRGAIITGTFDLTVGEVLYIICGQKGEDTRSSVDNAAPGGGGGSFVYTNPTDTYPLIAAGGGGSGARCNSAPGNQDASYSTSGNRSGSLVNGGSSGNGGTSNSGGSSYWAGGGSGWLTDGTGGNNSTNYSYTPGSSGGYGGRSPRNGALGGTRYNDGTDEGGDGGFGGGGGGGSDNMGGGGGGGYSGGGGARWDPCGNEPGGGGGSYNGGTSTTTDGYNAGHGYVTIVSSGGSIGGDNLGDHTATTNIRTNGNWVSNDGGSEGIYVDTDGDVGIATSSPAYDLHVNGTARVTGTLYDSGGDAGISGQVLTSTGTGTNWATAGGSSYWTDHGTYLSPAGGEDVYTDGEFYTPSGYGVVHHGATGMFGSAAGWTPPNSDGQGIWLESGYSEGGGFYADGNVACIWSPDYGLRLYDEDGMNLIFEVTGSGNLIPGDDDNIRDIGSIAYSWDDLYLGSASEININGDNGDAGQVLMSDGTNVYWGDAGGSGGACESLTQNFTSTSWPSGWYRTSTSYVEIIACGYSDSYSLMVEGSSGSYAETPELDASGCSSVTISYRYVDGDYVTCDNAGGENPDSGEGVYVQWWNGSSWTTIHTTNGATAYSSWQYFTTTIYPSNSDFKIRFYCYAGSGAAMDTWHFDNLNITGTSLLRTRHDTGVETETAPEIELPSYETVFETEVGDVLAMAQDGSGLVVPADSVNSFIIGIANDDSWGVANNSLLADSREFRELESRINALEESGVEVSMHEELNARLSSLESESYSYYTTVMTSDKAEVNCDASYGNIRKGDLLTISHTPGHARALRDGESGYLVGVALDNLAMGTGRITVLLQSGYYQANIDNLSNKIEILEREIELLRSQINER